MDAFKSFLQPLAPATINIIGQLITEMTIKTNTANVFLINDMVTPLVGGWLAEVVVASNAIKD